MSVAPLEPRMGWWIVVDMTGTSPYGRAVWAPTEDEAHERALIMAQQAAAPATIRVVKEVASYRYSEDAEAEQVIDIG